MNYIKLTIKVNSKDKPPYFPGSQLRGAFGYALKNVLKLDKNKNLYSKFFEEKNSYHQYRFDVRLGLNSYYFSFYLFEDSCEDIFNAICAFHEMLTKVGLGKSNKNYDDFKIIINDDFELDSKNFKLKDSFNSITQKFRAKKYMEKFVLNLVTPLRIKKNGILIKDSSICLESILTSIYQRSLALQNKQIEKLPFVPKYELISQNIYFNDLERYSNLQKTNMNLGGIMGEMVICDLDKKSFKLLSLGELIGVGKQTVFGLGKISIGELK